jgi:hypothetical protein
MALTKCPKCRRTISGSAQTCPNCGFLLAPKKIAEIEKNDGQAAKVDNTGCLFVVAILVVAVVAVVAVHNSSNRNNPQSESSSSSTSTAQTVSTPAPILPGSQWFYHHNDDGMSKGVIYVAQVSSSNAVNFQFPYAGAQHATLMLRTHPRHGESIIFSIKKGQILCHSYQDCAVLVRFDDDEPASYTAAGAADNSTQTIFIGNESKFLEKMAKAKLVRIAANIFQEGTREFDFDVSGFDQVKYIPKK